MLFFIKAKVTRRHAGISAPFQETLAFLVNANDAGEAQKKYENHVREGYARTIPSSVEFKYLDFASEIK